MDEKTKVYILGVVAGIITGAALVYGLFPPNRELLKKCAETQGRYDFCVKKINWEVKKMWHKYGAKRTEVDGIKFASKREAERYQYLKMLVKCNKIFDLELQVKFELCPKFTYAGKAERAISYVADFVYLDGNANKIVEDVKGFSTQVYKIKRKLFLNKYGKEYIFREVK